MQRIGKTEHVSAIENNHEMCIVQLQLEVIVIRISAVLVHDFHGVTEWNATSLRHSAVHINQRKA